MRRFIKFVHPALLTFALLLSARASAAQLVKSFEIGLPLTTPTRQSIDLLLFGIRGGSIKPLVPGVDCSIATMPAAQAVGVLVVGAGLDVTYPTPLARWATLTPRVGASALVLGGLLAPGGFEVTTGYNAGVGLVARTDPKTAVRLDITHHWLPGNWATSVVTIGIVQMHERSESPSPPAPPPWSAPSPTPPPVSS